MFGRAAGQVKDRVEPGRWGGAGGVLEVTGAIKDAIIARRGKQARNIAKVAAARRLLTLVFYGIRDGQIRCLSTTPGGSPPTTRSARAA